jgi:hypothetical protein
MFNVDPKWVLKRLGVEADPELVELGTMFFLRLQNATDKKAFLKDCLRKAMTDRR